MPEKPVIFISYSHRDRAWLDYVRSFLEALAPHGTLLIWDDEKLRIGDDWRGDIYSALDACRIFVLLVSRYAIRSKFIVEEEVGRILRRPTGEVKFCPIVVTPYYARNLDWLISQIADRPTTRRFLNCRTRHVIGKWWSSPSRLTEFLQAIVSGPVVAPTVLSTPASAEQAAPSARGRFPSIVDYGRLPDAPYKTLVGRAAELKRLDDAWADPKTNILSLIAEGGAGKSALVNEWLKRLQADNYRGAEAVLGWSFYSQGHARSGRRQARASSTGRSASSGITLDTTSATAKGEAIAEAMSRRRVLLVLDGVEPLQYGPGDSRAR